MQPRFVRYGRISHAERVTASYNIRPYLVNLRRDRTLNHAAAPYNTQPHVNMRPHFTRCDRMI